MQDGSVYKVTFLSHNQDRFFIYCKMRRCQKNDTIRFQIGPSLSPNHSICSGARVFCIQNRKRRCFLRSRSKTDGGITLKNLSDGGGEEGKWWELRSNKSEGTDVDSMESAPVLYQSLFHCWCVFPLTTGTWWLKTCQLINTTGCFALPSHSTQIWVCRSKSYGIFFCGSGANE